MSRYCLRSMEIGFEVPFIDFNQSNGVSDLSRSITDKYLSWFDIIKVGLKLYQLPNLNHILLFYLVVRIDNSCIDQGRSKKEWEVLKTSISKDIEGFLNENKVMFKKFD